MTYRQVHCAMIDFAQPSLALQLLVRTTAWQITANCTWDLSSESGHQTQQLLNLGLNASYDTRDKKCKTKSQKEVESYQQKMEFQATTQNIAFTQDIASKEGLKASHNGLSSIIEPP